MVNSNEFIRNLIQLSLRSKEVEIGCEECDEALDQYVDLLLAGEDPAQVMPALKQHLAVCSCCHSEYEALLVAMRSAMEDDAV